MNTSWLHRPETTYARDVETWATAAGPQFFVPPSSGTAANGKPIYSWDQAANQILAGVGGWNTSLGTAATVTYAFRSTAPGSMPDDTAGFSRFSTTQILATEEALRLWSEVANITFTRVGTGTIGNGVYSDSATILFSNYSSGQAAAAAFAFFPGSRGATSSDGDVWVNVSQAENANPAFGSYGAQTLAHEIGHAIGLSHPGPYNAEEGVDITYENSAVFYQDTRMYTIMSYFGSANSGGSLNAFAAGPQLFDIAAAQRLYGVNLTTRTGDTIYGFNSNTGHEHYTIGSNGQSPVFAIWDAGGNDTLDLSGFSSNSEIDLRQEAFSSAGPGNGGIGVAVGNISIARGAVIENAIGGAGADTIIGNAANNSLLGNGGADTITGGAGNDTINGGNGADIAVFAGTIASRTLLAFNGLAAAIDVAAHETDQITNVETFQFTNGNVAVGAIAAFNPVEYLATWGDLLTGYGANNNALVFQHYIDHGAFEGRTLDGFNNYLYLASNPDLLATLGADANAAALQYVQSGFAAHRPTSGFNALEYIASNPDLIAGLHSNATAGLAHYVEHGFAEHRATTSFDPYQYIASYPDLIAGFHGNAAGGLQHYLDHGFDEGRAADTFDALRYLASNLDLLGGFGHDETAAARHYVQHGFDKGRSLTSFDPYQYIASYADLITSIGANADAATLHFVDVGFGQGRARDTFDAAQYLANYADLQAAFGTDLFAATLHYIQSGYFEGRTDDPIGP